MIIKKHRIDKAWFVSGYPWLRGIMIIKKHCLDKAWFVSGDVLCVFVHL